MYVYEYIATANQTTFSGADSNSQTLSYAAGNIIVSYGGYDLPKSDYTATNGTSVVLDDGAVAGEIVRIVAFQSFVVANTYTQSQADVLLAAKLAKAGGTMTGDTGHADNVKAKFGAGDDLQIYHDGGHSRIKDVGTGNLVLAASTSVNIDGNNGTNIAHFYESGVSRFYGNVGVGVTPEASYAGRPTLRIGAGLTIGGYGSGNPSHHWINANAYQAASDATEKYIGADQASQLKQTNGAFTFNVAPNGTADAAISWANAMTINNAGIVTKPLQPAFSAGRGAGNVAVNTVYVCETVRFNIGSHYNNSNGRFTAPVSGRYHINVNLMCNDITQNNKHWNLRINGSEYQRAYSTNGGAYHQRWNWNGVISLQANDYVDIFSNNVVLYGGNALYSDFSGYLLG